MTDFFFDYLDGMYKFLRQDGHYLEEVYSTNELAFVFDTLLGTLFKHGHRSDMDEYFYDFRDAGIPASIISSRDWDLVEINKFINNTGYIKSYYDRVYGAVPEMS